MTRTAISKILSENSCDYVKGQEKAVVAEHSEQGVGERKEHRGKQGMCEMEPLWRVLRQGEELQEQK